MLQACLCIRPRPVLLLLGCERLVVLFLAAFPAVSACHMPLSSMVYPACHACELPFVFCTSQLVSLGTQLRMFGWSLSSNPASKLTA